MGRLGACQFEPGYYVYTGRAKRGLEKRIFRHRLKKKPIRWHIDYLTTTPGVRIVESVIHPTVAEKECQLNQLLSKKRGAEVVQPGFGASDCREGCISHLLFFKNKPELI